MRSRISPQYFSDSVSKSRRDGGGRDAGGPGGIGNAMGSHSELTLEHRDLFESVVASLPYQHLSRDTKLEREKKKAKKKTKITHTDW